MAIDASIIGGLRPPAPIAVDDPISQYAKVAQLKGILGQQQLQGLQTQQAQQSLDESQAARQALQASVSPTGEFDQAGYLKNLAKAGAPAQFQAAQKSFIEADKARADIKSAQAATLTHKIEAYKNLSLGANSPQDYAALLSAQWNDPDVGPILQKSGGTLQDKIAAIPQDPSAFMAFKTKAEKGMAGFQELLQKQAQEAETMRHNRATEGTAAANTGLTAQRNAIEASKADPYGLMGINTPGAGAAGGAPVSPAAAGPVPPGPRLDRNAPELPGMRTAVSAPLAPTVETPGNGMDLAAAQRGLANARTPQEAQGYRDAIASIQGDMGVSGAPGTPTAAPAGNAPAASMPGAPAAPVAAPRAPLNMNLHGDDFINQLPPQLASQVKALAEGRMAFPTGAAFRSPATQQMLSLVGAYDPNFDAVNYQARNKTRTDFTSGKSAQSLNALNTVMGHLDALDKAGKALNNGDYPLLNAAENYVGSAISPDVKSRLNQFEITKHAVVDEMERAYRGSGGSQAGIEDWKKTISASDSYPALQASIKQGLELLHSKIDSMGEQYNQGMGTTKNGIELLTPKAQEAFNRLSTGKSSVAAAPQTFDSLPDPSKFKDIVMEGPGGIRYRSDGKNWNTVRK